MSECDDCLCTQALEGGCVLDLCLVRWPSEDWCICVAGEWRVCLWAQMKGVQSWSLLHTWTFAQVNQFVKWQHKFKELQADKNNNSVIFYSFSCCSKPLRLWLIIETWIEFYLKITYEIYTVYKICSSYLTSVFVSVVRHVFARDTRLFGTALCHSGSLGNHRSKVIEMV